MWLRPCDQLSPGSEALCSVAVCGCDAAKWVALVYMPGAVAMLVIQGASTALDNFAFQAITSPGSERLMLRQRAEI